MYKLNHKSFILQKLPAIKHPRQRFYGKSRKQRVTVQQQQQIYPDFREELKEERKQKQQQLQGQKTRGDFGLTENVGDVGVTIENDLVKFDQKPLLDDILFSTQSLTETIQEQNIFCNVWVNQSNWRNLVQTAFWEIDKAKNGEKYEKFKQINLVLRCEEDSKLSSNQLRRMCKQLNDVCFRNDANFLVENKPEIIYAISTLGGIKLSRLDSDPNFIIINHEENNVSTLRKIHEQFQIQQQIEAFKKFGIQQLKPFTGTKALKKPIEEIQISKQQRQKVIGAMMLVAGGTVGAGIIALPVKTAAAGFIPTTITLIFSWLYMSITAVLLIEASTWFGKGTNITTMAQKTLGAAGKFISVGLYLVIYLATLAAYTAEGGRYLASVLNMEKLATYFCVPFVAIFGGVVFKGAKMTDNVNTLCLVLAIAAYLYLLYIGGGAIKFSSLLARNWGASVATLPIMVVAFCYHNMVPSLLNYVGNARDAVYAVVGGSAIPLFMYVSWELVILGALKSGPGVQKLTGDQIVMGMRAAAGEWATRALNGFSLFAIVTSFLGVTMGCVDFIQDLMGDSNNKQISAKIKSISITLVPALVIALSAPGVFYAAMEFSGTLRMVLFGVIPVLMVWRGRGEKNNKAFLPGGKPLLGLLLLVAVSMILVEMGGKVCSLQCAR